MEISVRCLWGRAEKSLKEKVCDRTNTHLLPQIRINFSSDVFFVRMNKTARRYLLYWNVSWRYKEFFFCKCLQYDKSFYFFNNFTYNATLFIIRYFLRNIFVFSLCFSILNIFICMSVPYDISLVYFFIILTLSLMIIYNKLKLFYYLDLYLKMSLLSLFWSSLWNKKLFLFFPPFSSHLLFAS